MNATKKYSSKQNYRVIHGISPNLPLPVVGAAFHDEDNEGLLPLTALTQPVIVELKVWSEAVEDDIYQLYWNNKLVGDAKTILDTDQPGDPLFLIIPPVLLVEGVHSLAYLAINHENGAGNYSFSVRVEVDLTPPGRPQLGPIKFPPEVEGGLTSDELTQLGDELSVEIGGYTGMAKHDVIRTYWGNTEGPGAVVTTDDMGFNRVIITYSRAFLESLGKFNGAVSYDIIDRAGNQSNRSLGMFLTLLLESLPNDYPAPVVNPALGNLIDYTEAKAGVEVGIPLYPDAAPLDLITLHWGNENSTAFPLPEGSEAAEIVLSILVPYEAIATMPRGTAQVTYSVYRAGEQVGSSLARAVEVNVTLPVPEVIEAPIIQGTSLTSPNIEDNFIDEDDYELNGRAIVAWKKGFEISDSLALSWGQETVSQWYQIKASDVVDQRDLVIAIPNSILKAQGTGAQIPVRFAVTRFGNPNASSSESQYVVVRSKDETPGGVEGLQGPSFNTTGQGVVGPIENPDGADVFVAPYLNIQKDQLVQFTFTAFDDNNTPIEDANFQDARELDTPDVINGCTFKVPAQNLKRICKGYGEASFKVIPGSDSNQSTATSRITRVRINMSWPQMGCDWIV
ncbi:hypothetical protein SAMN05444064_11078 [Pseudomonas syringae]|uniref:hypothetical protein n=1 Tax=Pseudomonas syringae TaxID=317 RepID=UPI00089AE08E|nr:hypothetical protein [Pseudomonas syringae]SDX01826.1 hypothetical protein SAMN05444514_11078 [Pseudomonas syringae]SFM14704.1 hypothetical protein SAMN05444064_11078 [Pseudomonas syringae]